MRLRFALTMGLALLLAAPAAAQPRKNKDRPGLVGNASYRVAAYSSEALLDFLEKPDTAGRAGKAASEYYEAIRPTLQASLEDSAALLEEKAPGLVKSVLEASEEPIQRAIANGLDQVFSEENTTRTVDFVGLIGGEISRQMSEAAPEITREVGSVLGQQVLDTTPGLVRAVTAELTAQMNDVVLPSLAGSMEYIAPMLSEGAEAVSLGILKSIVENTDDVRAISRATTDGVLQGTANALWTKPPPDPAVSQPITEERLGVLGEAVSKTLASTIQDSRESAGRLALEAGTVAGMALLPVALLGVFILGAMRLRNDHEKKMRDEDQDVIELRRRLKQAEARASRAEADRERNSVLAAALETLADLEKRSTDEAHRMRMAELYAGLVAQLPTYLRDPDAQDPRQLIEELRRSFGGQA